MQTTMSLDNTDDLLLQVLARIEGKVDSHEALIHKLFEDQNDKILSNTLGVRRILEKMEVRCVKMEKDLTWHARWIGGSASLLLGFCGTIALWLYNHVTKG